MAERRSPGPNGLEKGGLTARLAEVGLTAGQGVVWGDAARGTARPGVPDLGAAGEGGVAGGADGRKYTYLAVAIDPRTGRLWWEWQENMKGEEMARIWGVWAEDPAIDGWVWDGAGGHKGEDMQAVDAPQVVQPPYAPELNPVERGSCAGRSRARCTRTCRPSRTPWKRS